MKRLHKTFGVVVGSALAAMSLASCGDNGVNCGEGTVEKDGSCVPDGTTICTGSLTFDPATGTCALDPSACKDGTVLVDGACQDPGVVKVDATESAEPNDPKALNDTSPTPAPNAGTIAVPAIGAKGFVIKGCITPYRDVRDQDTAGNAGDGILDPDLDSWLVKVTQPTVLDVNADGVRGLVAGFALLSEDANLNALQYVRQAVSITNDRASREIYLPVAGTYRLNIADSRTLLNSIAGPGDANTCYYATITQKALPTAKPIALQPIQTKYEGKVDQYSYTPTEAEVFTINAIPKSANNQAGLTVIRNDEFSRLGNGDANDPTAFAFITNMKASDTIKIVYDPALVYSGAPVDVTLIAQPILATALPTNGALPLLSNVPNQGQAVGAFELNWTYMDVATANEIKHIKVSSGSDFNWSVIDAETLAPVATGTVAGLTPAALANANGSVGADEAWFRFAASGRYYVLFYSPGTAGNYTLNAVQTVATLGTFAVGTPSMNVMLGNASRNSAFGTITSNENWIVNSASSATFTGRIRLRRYLKTSTGRFDRDFLPVSNQTLNKDGSSNIGQIVSPGFDAQIARVSDTGTPANDTSVFSLNLTRRDYTDLDTVVEGTPVNSAAAAIGAGATKRYFVKAKKGSIVSLVVTPAGGAKVNADLLAPNEVSDGTFGGGGGSNTAFDVQATSVDGWIAILITNRGAAGTVALGISAKTPADFIDACTGGGAVLTQIADGSGFGLVGDEALTAAQTLPFNFSLFGQNVTSFKVSSNGWLSFAPNLPNDALYTKSEFDIASPSLAGSIAPYWTDLADIVICKKEEASKVTIQWTGGTFGSLFTPSVSVQTQAVIYKDQPRVDFLYGAIDKHASTGEDASIGVNSLDKASFVILGFEIPAVPADTAIIVSTAN
jgi:hypothetical protein